MLSRVKSSPYFLKFTTWANRVERASIRLYETLHLDKRWHHTWFESATLMDECEVSSTSTYSRVEFYSPILIIIMPLPQVFQFGKLYSELAEEESKFY